MKLIEEVSVVDVLFVHIRGTFHGTVILRLLVVFIKGNISICYKRDSTNRGQLSRAHNSDCNGSLDSDRASNACSGHTGKSRRKGCTTS